VRANFGEYGDSLRRFLWDSLLLVGVIVGYGSDYAGAEHLIALCLFLSMLRGIIVYGGWELMSALTMMALSRKVGLVQFYMTCYRCEPGLEHIKLVTRHAFLIIETLKYGYFSGVWWHYQSKFYWTGRIERRGARLKGATSTTSSRAIPWRDLSRFSALMFVIIAPRKPLNGELLRIAYGTWRARTDVHVEADTDHGNYRRVEATDIDVERVKGGESSGNKAMLVPETRRRAMQSSCDSSKVSANARII